MKRIESKTKNYQHTLRDIFYFSSVHWSNKVRETYSILGQFFGLHRDSDHLAKCRKKNWKRYSCSTHIVENISRNLHTRLWNMWPKFTFHRIESFQTMNISPYCVEPPTCWNWIKITFQKNPCNEKYEVWTRLPANIDLWQIHNFFAKCRSVPLPGKGAQLW